MSVQEAGIFRQVDNGICSLVKNGVGKCQSVWVTLTTNYETKCHSIAVSVTGNNFLCAPIESVLKVIPLSIGALVFSSPIATTLGFLKLTGIAFTVACFSKNLKPNATENLFRAVSLASAVQTTMLYLADTGLITTVASAILSVGSFYAARSFSTHEETVV